MPEGIIIKALSGYYYVADGEDTVTCRARGRFRLSGLTPLVGDRVRYARSEDGSGYVQDILPRSNYFIRPAVANIQLMVIVAAAVNPVSDPFLLDRMIALAEHRCCEVLLCINKADLNAGDELFGIYSRSGFHVLRTSAVTGEGIAELTDALAGKVAAFAGNSGVGKSSLLNAMQPGLDIREGEVSERLGRGRHTTRHVQLYPLPRGGYLADTPGFGSFDLDQTEPIRPEELPLCFREFAPYLGRCRFNDCSHLSEPGCAVLEALSAGEIQPSRHASYTRLRREAALIRDWERKDPKG